MKGPAWEPDENVKDDVYNLFKHATSQVDGDEVNVEALFYLPLSGPPYYALYYRIVFLF